MTQSNADDTTPTRGHPKGLMVLFSAEMWERFCFYTMRGLLTLYLIKALAMKDAEAFAIYGAYNALIYAAPVIGGRVADKILGYRRAVILGAVMMMIGEFVICLGTKEAMYLGMGVIIVGNGYFKANISSIVGKLYKDGDPRRDSGFTIFYMGINLGAVMATLIGAPIGEGLAGGSMGNAGYLVGFALAGVGMIAGLVIFIRGRTKLEGHGEPPDLAKLHAPFIAGMSRQTVTIAASFAVVPALYFLIQYHDVVQILLLVALAGVVVQLMQAAFRDRSDTVQRDRIFVLMILMFFNVVFWACFEQAGSSLTLFADRNVDRDVFGLFTMPASQTQFFNPAFIVLFGSVFSVLWVKLDERKLNPNIPMKFGLGIIQLGLGYLVLYVGASMAGVDARVPLMILALMYLLHTTGELFLSPIGLSMVTKLAPKDLTGSVMGAWFLTFAFAHSLAATIAGLTSADAGAGGLAQLVDAGQLALRPDGTIHKLIYTGQETLTPGYLDQVAAAAKTSLGSYVDIYTQMGLITVGIGVLLVLLSGLLNKMMHGVK
ncbi:MAG TPA: oligopeptide:H+ symporter [Enhygromyxa sp.]|nr:oligopeptide:H+ symporter [Enhygromyxa sp.]